MTIRDKVREEISPMIGAIKASVRAGEPEVYTAGDITDAALRVVAEWLESAAVAKEIADERYCGGETLVEDFLWLAANKLKEKETV